MENPDKKKRYTYKRFLSENDVVEYLEKGKILVEDTKIASLTAETIKIDAVLISGYSGAIPAYEIYNAKENNIFGWKCKTLFNREVSYSDEGLENDMNKLLSELIS